MPSAWVESLATKGGERRWRVRYRIGGKESKSLYGGKFKLKRDADARAAWIVSELATMRLPDIYILTAPAVKHPTFAEAAKEWQASRVDVRSSTAVQHQVALARVLPTLGGKRLDAITATAISALIAEMSDKKFARETIRKSIAAVAMTFEFAGVEPNPARDKKVKLPREEAKEINPPLADHIEAVGRLLAPRYRIAMLALDATGCRVNEMARPLVSDLDEAAHRWRISAANSKTKRPRWATLPDVLWEPLVASLPPRDDRDSTAPLFGVTDAQLRTAITRACRAVGAPHFSPHDFRHRRISLLHKAGTSWAEIGQLVGQRSLAVTADIYTHVLLDDREVDYSEVLHGASRPALLA